MKRLHTFFALVGTVALFGASRPRYADEGDRSILVCDGAFQMDHGQAFAFTVTLNTVAGKALDMGSGTEPSTTTFNDAEIGAKRVIGSVVENTLQIETTTETFAPLLRN